jgi:hypothetical protein
MDVESCIVAYIDLSREIFEKRGLQYLGGKAAMAWNSMRGSAWFNATGLEKEIPEILE